jgi:sec-independent protein translocase protein TatA
LSAGTEEGKASVHPMLAEIFGVDGVIVLIVIVAVLFGGTQIPKLARSLGSAQSEFKKGLADGAKGDAGGEKPNTADDASTKDSDKPSASG